MHSKCGYETWRAESYLDTNKQLDATYCVDLRLANEQNQLTFSISVYYSLSRGSKRSSTMEEGDLLAMLPGKDPDCSC